MEQEKVGIAGVGALGKIVAKALLDGMDGYRLHAVSDLQDPGLPVPSVTFESLAKECDVVVECLPPAAVPALAELVLGQDKTLIMISSCALILYPEIKSKVSASKGRIIVPSGALSGLDAVHALAQDSIRSAKIISRKPPKGFRGAPYIIEQKIDVDSIHEPFMIFSGNVLEAAKAFPANVNVAASLSLAGIGPERTTVEVWADPQAQGNSHEILVEGRSSVIRSSIENVPDPANPKSSMQAAYSLIAALKKRKTALTVI